MYRDFNNLNIYTQNTCTFNVSSTELVCNHISDNLWRALQFTEQYSGHETFWNNVSLISVICIKIDSYYKNFIFFVYFFVCRKYVYNGRSNNRKSLIRLFLIPPELYFGIKILSLPVYRKAEVKGKTLGLRPENI